MSPSRWGLVARLVPAPYPPNGAVEIRYGTPGAGDPESGRLVVVLPPIALPENGSEVASGDGTADTASPEPPPVPEKGPAVQEQEDPEASTANSERPEPPAGGGGHRFIVVGNMREEQRAVLWATDLRRKGYRSEVYLNARGYFVVTLDRLPLEEARSKRTQAVSAGDVPENSYLIPGTSFREKISF